ncbi:MAG: NAD(P)H-binding protein [Myxococcales bacterium]|nr:NAD(P)H-binding protein [Myxococcales bacterium]
MSAPTPVAWIAGATGYTGNALVRLACAAGLRVHAHVRPDSPRLAEHRARFEAEGAIVETTPWEPAALAEALARVQPTQVYALLGTTQSRARAAAAAGEAPADYAAVDVGLTLMLHDACVAAGIRPRFVYLSALGAGPSALGAYMQARWQVEARLHAGALPFTIARPSFISGPDREERRVGERIGARVGDALLGVVGALGGRRVQARYGSLSADQLARALLRLAADPEAEGGTFEADRLRELA